MEFLVGGLTVLIVGLVIIIYLQQKQIERICTAVKLISVEVAKLQYGEPSKALGKGKKAIDGFHL
jgi:hypothetical protein